MIRSVLRTESEWLSLVSRECVTYGKKYREWNQPTQSRESLEEHFGIHLISTYLNCLLNVAICSEMTKCNKVPIMKTMCQLNRFYFYVFMLLSSSAQCQLSYVQNPAPHNLIFKINLPFCAAFRFISSLDTPEGLISVLNWVILVLGKHLWRCNFPNNMILFWLIYI